MLNRDFGVISNPFAYDSDIYGQTKEVSVFGIGKSLLCTYLLIGYMAAIFLCV